MQIIKSFPETLSMRDVVKLTQAKSTKKMLDAAGSVLEPKCWVLSEDTDRNGETKTALVLEADGELFGTISGTFIDTFIGLSNCWDLIWALSEWYQDRPGTAGHTSPASWHRKEAGMMLEAFFEKHKILANLLIALEGAVIGIMFALAI